MRFLSSIRNSLRQRCDGIFVLGVPHSGTSVITVILDSHPNLAALETETGAFFVAPKRITETLEGFDQFAKDKGVSRWVEKTPDHLLHFQTLRDYCPRHPVVLILRDCRDVIASLKCRFNDFQKALQVWERSARIVVDLLENPRDPFVFPVVYEQLIHQPAATLERLCRKIGEPYNPEMLEFHTKTRHWYSGSSEKPPNASQRFHSQHRNWQINQPLFDSTGRWTKDLSVDDLEALSSANYSSLIGAMNSIRSKCA